MSRAIMKFRPGVPSNRVELERLEQRQVLSTTLPPGFPAPGPFGPTIGTALGAPGGASLQTLIRVSPGDGDVLPASNAPSAIVVHLSGAAMSGWSNGGITLYRVGTEGAAAPVFGGEQSPDAIRDQTNNTVTIPLGGALEPGRYRVVLVGGFGSFSHLIGNGSWDFMEDQTLAEFEVRAGADRFAEAIDAGTAGPVERDFPGALIAAGEEALYKVELGGDQPLWRLGLQLDAQRIGSDLLATLTVYDAGGNVVASSEGRRGLASAPVDPYLFAGLEPGTYYVGVSAAAGPRGAGAYRLAIAADPVAGPTRVTGFSLDRTHGAPTGFTITFSDAIAPDALGSATSPVWVVDAAGAIHPARLSAAADGLRRLSFVFDQPLPAGSYALLESRDGGLADLIGREPVADGLPAGLLANWTVAPYLMDVGPDSTAPETSWLDAAHLESLIDNAVGAGGALGLRFGVGMGATTPTAPTAHAGGAGFEAVAAPAPTFVGALDSSLFGRPTARNDGTTGMGAIPLQGRALLAAVAREGLSGETSTPSPADDGLARSPDGALEIAGLGPAPTARPRLVEFPRDRSAESTGDGVRADIDALERIEESRLVDASARAIEWLFGAPVPGASDNGVPATDNRDARLLARIDAQEAKDSPDADEQADRGASRAGLGVPTGAIILAAVAYRLHRRPPRWWRRRRPTPVIEAAAHAEPHRPPVSRGPRHMIPKRAASRRAGASRTITHR